LFNKKQVQFSA